MPGIEKCGECGVPLMISRELTWENNGVISLTRSPRNRMILYESRVIDNLFKGVEELIGLPIEHIVIESRRREVKRYIEKSFPKEMGEALEILRDSVKRDSDTTSYESALRFAYALTQNIIDIGKIYGYGDSRQGDLWEKGDPYPWRVNIVRGPYSIPFWAADALGSNEAIEGIDQWVRYERIGGDTYRITTYPGEHPVELKERMQRKRYDFKPGDITYERCGSCGLPGELARNDWNTEKGIITDPYYGRRMAIYGPLALEVVLDDLEAELGEEVPKAVVEAERRYVKSRVSEQNWRMDGSTFNRLTALRGMGNIADFEADGHHLALTIQNSCLHLLMVGMAQAIYELALNKEVSTYEYDLKEDGDLDITVRA